MLRFYVATLGIPKGQALAKQLFEVYDYLVLTLIALAAVHIRTKPAGVKTNGRFF